jgi:peptidoglycan/LPS O-acetylase OafA/YrhL
MANNSASNKQFAGLEIARFLCALAITFWHYQHFFTQGVGTVSELPTDQVVTFPFYRNVNGHFAVPIFWMISRFIFFWKYSAAINDGRVSAYRFSCLDFRSFIRCISQP